MSRDINDRLQTFLSRDLGRVAITQVLDEEGEDDWLDEWPREPGNAQYDRAVTILDGFGNLEVRRIALTEDQIDEFNPPPNPAKITDPRAKGYIALHGNTSWELDALSPVTLEGLIEEHVSGLMDAEDFDAAVAREIAEQDRIKAVSRRWDEVEEFVG